MPTYPFIHRVVAPLCGVAATFLPLQSVAQVLSDADLSGAYHTVTPTQRTSVHDPSILVDTVADPTAETFYVIGSHMGFSRSTDLIHWTSSITGGETTSATLYGKRNADGTISTCSYNQAFRTNEVTRVVNAAGDTVPFGNFDASAWNTALNNYNVDGNQWAADAVYNPVMKKWLYYVSLNGARWNSVIVCLSADRVTGPYVYQGPVVYSGFNVDSISPDFRDCDLPIVLGDSSALPERYQRGDLWGSYWPHAIDPCVYYDAEGNLWLAYGSWSGGIYTIQLDEHTGLRDYTVTYPAQSNTTENVTSDPYFGTKIAGGYYVSGEGPYIRRIGSWYYLFLSYGFYSPDGGYEMRVFRSANPNGPFRDCSTTSGTSAIYYSWQLNYGPNATTNRGMKLMGSYQWDPMPVAELAQGHNSAMTDREGRTFVVYHTKFNDGTAGHAVRVHQLLTNEEGWLCVAPYEFGGETITQDEVASQELFSAEEIAGDYQLLRHTYRMDYEHYAYNTPVNITLNADGSVQGAYSGSWSVTPGTSYITLTLDGIAYRGALIRQTIDYTDIPALCFTAVSSSSGVVGQTRALSIWGSKAETRGAIAYTLDQMTLPVAEGKTLYTDVTLPTVGKLGCNLTWHSSRPQILSDEGKINPSTQPESVVLTLTISKDGATYSRDYNLTVSPLDGDIHTALDAYYDFEGDLTNRLDATQQGEALAESAGTQPVLEANAHNGGTALRQYFGYPSASSSSYVRFPNSLQGNVGEEGATISLFVNRTESNEWDAIWSFLDDDDSDGVSGRLYLTANTYLGYNGTGGWFDANYPTTQISVLGTQTWHHVALTCTTEGWTLYLDGEPRYTQSDCVSFNSGGFSDYNSVLRLLSSAASFYFGYGSWWGSAPLLLDDLTLYHRALSAADVMTLYVTQNEGRFSVEASGIEELHPDASLNNGALNDLTGRRTVLRSPGLYIRNGKVVWMK